LGLLPGFRFNLSGCNAPLSTFCLRDELDTTDLQCGADLIYRSHRHTQVTFLNTNDHLSAYARTIRELVLAQPK
jgi:hypothetical protein